MLRKFVHLLRSVGCGPTTEVETVESKELTSGLSEPHPTAKVLRRQALACISIDQMGLFGRRWTDRLLEANIRSAADFVSVRPHEWAQKGIASKSVGKLRRWQQAVRLASAVGPMRPYEALMLIAIHRRSLHTLASQRPGHLRQDLLRFVASTAGHRMLRSRPLPDQDRVARWIEAAKKKIDRLDAAANLSRTA